MTARLRHACLTLCAAVLSALAMAAVVRAGEAPTDAGVGAVGAVVPPAEELAPPVVTEAALTPGASAPPPSVQPPTVELPPPAEPVPPALVPVDELAQAPVAALPATPGDEEDEEEGGPEIIIEVPTDDEPTTVTTPAPASEPQPTPAPVEQPSTTPSPARELPSEEPPSDALRAAAESQALVTAKNVQPLEPIERVAFVSAAPQLPSTGYTAVPAVLLGAVLLLTGAALRASVVRFR